MSLKDQTTLRVVLYEGIGAQPLEGADRFAAVSALLENGFGISRVAAEGRLAPADRASLLVLGRFEGGRPPEAEDGEGRVNIRFRDISGIDAKGVADTVESVRAEAGAARHGEWKPWFPVIDYDRCTNCMQCLSFCLFGVYGASADGKIEVQHESNCKTDCPACSRVCPEVAIMFPKYKAGPINGDAISTEDVRREAMKIDISAL